MSAGLGTLLRAPLAFLATCVLLTACPTGGRDGTSISGLSSDRGRVTLPRDGGFRDGGFQDGAPIALDALEPEPDADIPEPDGDGGFRDRGPVDAMPQRDAARPDGGPDATTTDRGRLDATPAPDATGTPDLGIEVPTTCTAPITDVDVSSPTTVVGNGTRASCTEAAFAAAVQRAGIITFNCGGPATIPITSEKVLRRNQDTTIDGAGLITLDGLGETRILKFDSGDFRRSNTKVTLQHMTFANGSATGTAIPPAPPPCSSGFDIDGGGAAIIATDAILHILDCTFLDNHAAGLGPDVAGGGVYALGSLDTTIVGSTFIGNSAANGGGVGSLQSNLTLVNNVFASNRATGFGANIPNDWCPPRPPPDGQRQTGSGGNGGAVSIDGMENFTFNALCNTFTNNTGGALGGAIFRTPNAIRQTTNIDRSSFDANVAKEGGALYFHNTRLNITDTTISNNHAENGGGIQSDGTIYDFTNVTLVGNRATHGLGGALFHEGSGTIVNCTIGNNRSDGGFGYFGAAISTSSALTVRNTIFWNNTALDPYNPMSCTRTLSGTADIQWPRNLPAGDPDRPCVSGIQFSNAQLGPLRNNGGTTLTMAPEAGDAILQVGTSCPARDQTGRPRRNPCTIGALER